MLNIFLSTKIISLMFRLLLFHLLPSLSHLRLSQNSHKDLVLNENCTHPIVKHTYSLGRMYLYMYNSFELCFSKFFGSLISICICTAFFIEGSHEDIQIVEILRNILQNTFNGIHLRIYTNAFLKVDLVIFVFDELISQNELINR